MEKLKKVSYIIVHHSQREKDSPDFIRHRHIHNRKWEDIGYHFLIGNGTLKTKKGKLYPGRKENLQGAHAYSFNDKSIGICLIGNFDISKPSKKQIKTLIKFLKKKIMQYNIPVKNILGHRELPNVKKTCPGENIDMNKIREKLKD